MNLPPSLGPGKLYYVCLLYSSDVKRGEGIGKGIVGDKKNEHPIGSSFLLVNTVLLVVCVKNKSAQMRVKNYSRHCQYQHC